MINNKISERSVSPNITMLSALKQMDLLGVKSLLVIDNKECFSGILSIGDIQRAIIREVPIDETIKEILRPEPKVATSETSFLEVKEMMLRYRMEFLPVINHKKEVIDLFFWDEVFGIGQKLPLKKFELPVVIMAGGLGTRLKPLTNVLPKPLIPLNEKSIIEEIIERFGNHGCKDFYISVNYKAEFIEYYLKNQNIPYRLNFFKELIPMGTVGSLSLLKGKINQTFFVSNCDILIEQDYSEILEYHKANKNEITIVAALKHFPIPYGTIETGANGQLLELHEKPDLLFKINSGMYILEPHLINEVPNNTLFHITQLIDNLKSKNRNIGVFPVSEKSWKDIGNLNEYFKGITSI